MILVLLIASASLADVIDIHHSPVGLTHQTVVSAPHDKPQVSFTSSRTSGLGFGGSSGGVGGSSWNSGSSGSGSFGSTVGRSGSGFSSGQVGGGSSWNSGSSGSFGVSGGSRVNAGRSNTGFSSSNQNVDDYDVDNTVGSGFSSRSGQVHATGKNFG